MKMKRKNNLSAALAVLCSITCTLPILTAPMTVHADLGVVLGQVDNIEGIGITDAVAVLQHYARESAGLPGTLNDVLVQVSADVNGDDYITLEDAAEILNYYARESAGMTAHFSVYDVEDAAFSAYQPIINAFVKKCKNQGLSPDYSYAYIDSNLIPELVLSPDTSHAAGGCTIYTYANGKPVLLGEDCFGYCGWVKYEKLSGSIITDNGYTGFRWVTVQKLRHAKLTTEKQIELNYNTNVFTIDGVSKSKAVAEQEAYNITTYGVFETGRGNLT